MRVVRTPAAGNTSRTLPLGLQATGKPRIDGSLSAYAPREPYRTGLLRVNRNIDCRLIRSTEIVRHCEENTEHLSNTLHRKLMRRNSNRE